MTAERWTSWEQVLAAVEQRWERLGCPPIPIYAIDYPSRTVVVGPSATCPEGGFAPFAAIERMTSVVNWGCVMSGSPDRVLAYAMARERLVAEGLIEGEKSGGSA